MNNKWFVSVLLIFIVLIVCIGGVSAADNMSDTHSTDNQTSDLSSSESADSNQVLTNSNNKSNLKSDVAVNNQEEFEALINDSSVNNTVIYLNNNTYSLGPLKDIWFRNLTICGGSSLNDNLRSTIMKNNENETPIFHISLDSSVNFIRLDFINSNQILTSTSSKLIFDDCSFNNITQYGSDSFNSASLTFNYKANVTIKNCRISNGDSKFINAYSCNITMINTTVANVSYHPKINEFGYVMGDYYLIYINSRNLVIDNCTFENISNFTSIINLDGSKAIVNNSVFDNNGNSSISFVHGGNLLLVNNSIFSNNKDTVLNNYFANCIINITNSLFVNNTSPFCGAAVFCGRGNVSAENTSFINNSAVYGGAIYSKPTRASRDRPFTNLDLNNCSFTDNYAKMGGGAISFSSNTTNINNTIFKNNSAGLFGGAIILSNSTNSTIANCIFENNNGTYGKDLSYFYTNLSLENNSNMDVYQFNDTIFNIAWNWVTYFDVNQIAWYYTYGNLTGFCIEKDMFSPFYDTHAYFNDTNIAINLNTYKYVGNYVKYLIYNYYGKIPELLLSKLIWTFTNLDYYNPDFLGSVDQSFLNTSFLSPIKYLMEAGAGLHSPKAILRNNYRQDTYYTPEEELALYISIINETINAVNNGVIIPDHGATKLNENGSVSVYDFSTVLSPACQNLILFGVNNLSNPGPDVSIIKITNDPVVYRGNDTSFDIVVRNTGNIMLSNVTVTEDSYDDLSFKSWSPITGNWTYNYVNGKHTWTLTGYLPINETVSFNVVFTTVNSTVGNKTNTVSVTTNENATGNASNVTEVIENKTSNNSSNYTPNKPTPFNNKTVENNNTPKADVKTTDATGYPFIALIIALIGIIGVRTRRR